jgi:alkylation response protein AidB-like acyl-CoA dehydrogenase
MGDLFTDGIDRELVDRARELQPLLARNAAACEQERRIVDENLAALEAADLFTVLTPKRCGGRGATLATQLAIAAELGRGCGSTAWVQTLLNVTTWTASLLCVEAQDEIFAGGVPRVCGILTPSGTATPVDGGFLVSGRWGFASGCLHADWATVGVHVLDAAGVRGAHDGAYLPLGELGIEDTWHVAGMRGTGSNTLVADEVFVPTHRFALSGYGGGGTVTPPAEAAASDTWPLGGTLALVLLGPTLGIAEGALATVLAKADKRPITYTSHERQIDSPVVLADLARAGLDVDTARLQVLRAAADIDGPAAAGGAPDGVTSGRIRGACGYAAEALRRAVDSLVSIGGASSFAEASSLQRSWRDLNVGTRHAFVATAPVLEVYGRALFGLDQVMDLV